MRTAGRAPDHEPIQNLELEHELSAKGVHRREVDSSGRVSPPRSLPRAVRRGTLALVIAAAVAAGFGFAAERVNAAVIAQVAGSQLTIIGDSADNRIALRLKAGSPNTLQVDLGDDGSANFSFDRAKFAGISVLTLGGADVVRIDEANGVFTDTEDTAIFGGAAPTRSPAAPAPSSSSDKVAPTRSPAAGAQT